jgi:hypothetical protein
MKATLRFVMAGVRRARMRGRDYLSSLNVVWFPVKHP